MVHVSVLGCSEKEYTTVRHTLEKDILAELDDSGRGRSMLSRFAFTYQGDDLLMYEYPTLTSLQGTLPLLDFAVIVFK